LFLLKFVGKVLITGEANLYTINVKIGERLRILPSLIVGLTFNPAKINKKLILNLNLYPLNSPLTASLYAQ